MDNFTPTQKEQIFRQDNYRCVMCGKGRENGVEIYTDHILVGQSITDNGQTLCRTHKFWKKNLNQTESGKKMFIHLYELAKAAEDEEMVEFCRHILETFEEHDINGHIEWKR